MAEDRRLHPRAVVRLPVSFRRAGETSWQEGVVHDLSAGGAGLRTSASLRLKDELRLRLDLPASTRRTARRLDLGALVVRRAEIPAPEPGPRHHAGLQFLILDGDDFEDLRVFVWERLHGSGAPS